MKKLFIGLVAAALFAVNGTRAQNHPIEILPKPVKIVAFQNAAVLSGETSVYLDPKANLNQDYVTGVLKEAGIDPVYTTKAKKAKLAFKLNAVPSNNNDEAYRLAVMSPDSKKQIVATADARAGLLYALQTLRQMTTPQNGLVTIPACVITDAPAFPWRAYMQDESRHFQGAETVKNLLDEMARLKMNTFHWHLVDDQGWRIEIKKYPELTKIGSQRKQTVIGKNTGKYDATPYGPYFFTQEEIKEVIRYAADRYITIIPEIELPGHALAALATYPELGCTGGPYEVCQMWGVFPEVFCPGNEKTFEFWEGVLDEVVELFPGEIIHIGGDECPRDAWKKCKKCQTRMKQENMKEEGELQDYTVHRIEAYLKGKGKRVIGWDEILEGDVSKTAIVMSWRGKTGGIKGAKRGNEVVMVPNDYAYFDYYQSKDVDKEPFSIGGFVDVAKVYSLDPTEGLTAEEGKKIIGVQANLWTEYITTFSHAQYMLLPRMAALAEVAWTPQADREYSNFLNRAKLLTQRYEALGYNFAKHILQEAKSNE